MHKRDVKNTHWQNEASHDDAEFTKSKSRHDKMIWETHMQENTTVPKSNNILFWFKASAGCSLPTGR